MDSLILGQNNTSLNCHSCVLKHYDHRQWRGFNECNFNEFNASQTQQRRLKTDTPREKKDDKYYEKRKRNNMAAKKSREAKRRRDNEMALKLFLLEKENMMLKFRLSALTDELEIIKRTLVFYNSNKVIWQNNPTSPFQIK